jgi:Zn-dependent metalloprotease
MKEKRSIQFRKTIQPILLALLLVAVLDAYANQGKAPTSSDNPALNQLYQRCRVDEVLTNETGIPTFIRGDLTPVSRAGSSIDLSLRFFEENRDLYRMSNPPAELTLKDVKEDELGMTHVTFSQTYSNIPVFLGELKVHMDREKRITAINGHYLDGINVGTKPAITLAQAQEKIVQDLGSTVEACNFQQGVLVVFRRDSSDYLAWLTQVRTSDNKGTWKYLVDALFGEVLHRYSLIYE